MLIGLTGGYCAGKNLACAMLEARGWECIDADRLGREAMGLPEVRDAIVRRFGPGVALPDGSLDRRAIAAIVFSDPAALADQEAIVHPAAIRLVNDRIAAAEAAARARGEEPRVCVNAALLHRAGILSRLDAVIELRAPFLVRLLRGMRRDGEGLGGAMRRLTRQRGFAAALRKAAAEEAARAGVPPPPMLGLRNDRGPETLEAAVQKALRAIEGQRTRH